MKLFHGSPNYGITEFSIEKQRYEPVEGVGVYLTTEYKIARGYAGSEGCVYICEVKNGAIFDATQSEEFEFLFEQVSKRSGVDLMALEYIKPTIKGLVSGQFQISDDCTGLFWQIKNLLFNDEGFCQRTDGDKKIGRD